MEKVKKSAAGTLAGYLLFIFLFLAVVSALVALCNLFGSNGRFEGEVGNLSSQSSLPVIVIDAGHGGEDGGAVGKIGTEEIYEKDLNLDIALMLREMLTDAGFTVIMTRTEDILLYDRNVDFQGRKKKLDLAARLTIGENTSKGETGAVFVSIHMNAFPQTKYKGLQVYYSKNDPKSKEIATVIQENARTILQEDNTRTIKQATDTIYLLEHLQCPAVLVECGFLSNPEECVLLNTSEYRQKVAYTLFTSLRACLKALYNEQ